MFICTREGNQFFPPPYLLGACTNAPGYKFTRAYRNSYSRERTARLRYFSLLTHFLLLRSSANYSDIDYTHNRTIASESTCRDFVLIFLIFMKFCAMQLLWSSPSPPAIRCVGLLSTYLTIDRRPGKPNDVSESWKRANDDKRKRECQCNYD